MVPLAEWMPPRKRQKKTRFVWRYFYLPVFPGLGFYLPPTVHCWQLDFSISPWCLMVGTCPWRLFLAHLSLCDLRWGFACEQEGKWDWWTEISAPVCSVWCGHRGQWDVHFGGLWLQSLPAERGQPLGECWIFQNLEVPYFNGKSSGAVQLITPLPFHVFPFVFLLYNWVKAATTFVCSSYRWKKTLSVSQSSFSLFLPAPAPPSLM